MIGVLIAFAAGYVIAVRLRRRRWPEPRLTLLLDQAKVDYECSPEAARLRMRGPKKYSGSTLSKYRNGDFELTQVGTNRGWECVSKGENGKDCKCDVCRDPGLWQCVETGK